MLIATRRAAETAVLPIRPGATPPAKILVVDDIESNRDFLVTLLRHYGHQLFQASDGKEGLAVVRAVHPDLVITDVLMPVMDGYEFVRQLRLDAATSRIPVVFYTAHYAEREAMALALSSGVAHVLTKPVTSAEVLGVVDRVLSAPAAVELLPEISPLSTEFDRKHLRLLTDKLSEKVGDLLNSNSRLRALISIEVELAAQEGSGRRLLTVCEAAMDLFSATYVTIGILDRKRPTLAALHSCGTESLEWIGVGNTVSGILGRAITERRSFRGNNPGGDPARLGLPALHPPITAFLTAPITSAAHVHGWICLVGNEGRGFTEEDEHLLSVLTGQVARIYDLEFEIVDRKEAESALPHERDRAQRYLDTAEVMLLALDTEGRITLANRYACAISGWTSDELAGRDFIETCAPARMRDELRAKFQVALDGHLPLVEALLLTKSGEERLIEWRNTVQRNDAGLVVATFSSGTDITERKRSEAALRESEARKAAVLESVVDCIVTMDAEGRIIEFNAASERTFGFAKADAMGRLLADLIIPPALREMHAAGLRAYVATGEGRILGRLLEMTALRADGSEIPVELTITAIRSGESPTFTGVLRDITARKLADATRARLAAIVDSSDDAIFSSGLDDTILTWNAGAERLYGYDASEMIGRNRTVVVPVDKGHELAAILGQAVAGKASDPFESQRTRKDGSVVDISLVISPMTDPSGRVIGTSTISRDITSQKKGESDLKRAEERMRFTLEAAGVGIWDLDFATGVLQWSEILEAQHGLLPGSFGGTQEAFIKSIHPDDRKAVMETMKSHLSGGEFSLEHRAIWPDKSIRWLSGVGRIHLGANGEPVRGIGISLDVTDRRKLEEQYQQAQKMDAIGRLAGGVAHDFNNLLTVILGNCELMMAELEPGTAAGSELLEIQKAGTSAAGLTRQLLAFSRKQIIEPTVLDMNQVVANLRPMLGRLIGENVKILLGLRPSVATVKADRGQLEQVLVNLAVNARDAMPNGGTLTIETAQVDLDGDYAVTHPSVKPGRYVALTVSDTGTGMSPEVQARLFEPFFTTKDVGKGTGLGLSTVHGVVTGNGGSVAVYSEVGRGTSFTAYFPIAAADEMAVMSSATVARPRTGPETVLVVEDAAGLRELTKRLLDRLGYRVLVASNADEALSEFSRNPLIDLLLTDVVMPGASGPELTKQLLEQRPGLKVIYMSGYTEEAIIHHGVINPGIAFLHKPFTSETLGQKVREVLDR